MRQTFSVRMKTRKKSIQRVKTRVAMIHWHSWKEQRRKKSKLRRETLWEKQKLQQHGKRQRNYSIIFIHNSWTIKISGDSLWVLKSTKFRHLMLIIQCDRRYLSWHQKVSFQGKRVKEYLSSYSKMERVICMILGSRDSSLMKSSSMVYFKIRVDLAGF